MATLYLKNGIWYLSVMHQRQRITRSLGTRDKLIAKKLKPAIESELLAEVTGIKRKTQNISFSKLSDIYLNHNHQWTARTFETVIQIIKAHVRGKPLPKNPTTRAIHIRHINCCWNWGLKNGYINHTKKLRGDTKGEARHRVLTHDELSTLFDGITDPDFNQFVRFAYYTGARSGEIRHLKLEQMKGDHFVVIGKSGRRLVKLNSQAQAILSKRELLWDYSSDFVSHKFKKEARRLKISDIRFHDLRRTFGYNLIKQGRPIYEVSKLLGHSSVTTTERHYAPLLATDVEDFIL